MLFPGSKKKVPLSLGRLFKPQKAGRRRGKQKFQIQIMFLMQIMELPQIPVVELREKIALHTVFKEKSLGAVPVRTGGAAAACQKTMDLPGRT